ncbi:MAG: LCP family protein [Anaerolineae bacterium]|nr:LCP family protein [Anaerolineae bacterium]
MVRVFRPRQLSRPRSPLAIGCTLLFLLLWLPLMMCGCGLLVYAIVPPASTNIVIMGLDSRGSEGVIARTDSLVVLGIKPRGLGVAALSIPRDIFINVPNYGLQRINTINVLGETDDTTTGPDLLMASIDQSFDMQIDHYVRLDFAAFEALVDAVGGIEVDIPHAVDDYAYPTSDGGTIEIHFDPGPQTLDGTRALQYARTRHSDDDYQRAVRQQLVMSALGRKLLNPFTWPAAVNAVLSNTETDMTIADLFMIAPPIIIRAGNYEMLVINRDYILPGDGYVIPNYERLSPWLTEHLR